MSYWITPDTRTFMSRGYLPEGQSVEERIKVIAKRAEDLLEGKWPGFAEKLEEYLLKGWLSLSSPIWANFGTDRGLPISCNGSYVDDSVLSILTKQAEIGMMSKYGSGTSLFMGAIRKRGSEISTGGVADGPVHYVSMYENTVNTISQNNVRRGSCAVYLNVDHPDIKEFLELKEEGSHGQHISIGVTIPDQWMEDLIAGDPAKRKIWSRIIKKRFETGYPYIVFSDTANREKPEWWQNAQDIVHASNLCVVGSTLIRVRPLKSPENEFSIQIKDLGLFQTLNGDTEVLSYDFDEGKKVFKKILAFAQTSPKAKLIRITDETTGKTLTCTPDHKVWTENRGYVLAKDLVETDVLKISE
jgi:ribonucleotide reductase alpha subunit